MRQALLAEAQAAAGNSLLSKAEQDALAPSLLKDAAVAVRATAWRRAGKPPLALCGRVDLTPVEQRRRA